MTRNWVSSIRLVESMSRQGRLDKGSHCTTSPKHVGSRDVWANSDRPSSQQACPTRHRRVPTYLEGIT